MSDLIQECPADDAVEAQLVAKAIGSVEQPFDNTLLSKRLSQWLGMLRGMQLWFHGAHHVTRGASFVGDHIDIFGRIYVAIQDEIDGAVEKAVGATGDEGIACPMHITKMALQVLQSYPSPPAISSLAMAAVGLEIERNYVELVEQMFAELEEAGMLSLGLNDMLAASANVHEGHGYLLQQRVKTELEN